MHTFGRFIGGLVGATVLLLISSVFVYGAYVLYTLALTATIFFAIPLGIMAIVLLVIAILVGSGIVTAMVG